MAKYISKNSGIYDVFPNPEATKKEINLGCFAVMMPIDEIFTDTARFQNRTNAFSELSADSVANNYDKNKFDPIVIWEDPKQKKYFVLSGHSRYEGMKRRKAREIPSRFFEGSEAEAIQFARVDANRSANVENLIEDLKAYVLMRDGDPKRDLKPAKKSELERVFKGKHNKLDAYSYLNPEGLFIQALQSENKTEFPHLETRALWVGELRKEYQEDFTNTYEDDCFNFVFADATNNRLSKDDFLELVKKRISWGEARLFPECSALECEPVENLKEKGLQGEMYKRLNALQKELDLIKERFGTTKQGLKIYTEPEKEAIKKVSDKLKDEQSRIKRDLKISEEAPSLFGFDAFETKDFDFSRITSALEKLKLKKSDIVDVVMNPNTICYGTRKEYNFVGFTAKSTPLYFFCENMKTKLLILELRFATEDDIKHIYCNG